MDKDKDKNNPGNIRNMYDFINSKSRNNVFEKIGNELEYKKNTLQQYCLNPSRITSKKLECFLDNELKKEVENTVKKLEKTVIEINDRIEKGREFLR